MRFASVSMVVALSWTACGARTELSRLGPTDAAAPKDAAAEKDARVQTTPMIAAGGSHTCAVTLDGVLKCWGDDEQGQLGDGAAGTGVWSTTPVTVPLSGTTSLGTGVAHSCAVVSGRVYCWGDGVDGRLGDGLAVSHPTPTLVPSLSNVLEVSAGDDFSCAVLSGGEVKCWGANLSGELGNGQSGPQQNSPVSTGIVNAAHVHAELGRFACAALVTGKVKCWGANDAGQCGDGSFEPKNDSPVDVASLGGALSVRAGYSHACALLQGGTFECWGADDFGQLGDGQQQASVVPVGNALSGVVAVATGSGFSCALLASGAVECWGIGGYGQMGDGTAINRATPVVAIASGAVAIAAGDAHACAYMSDGSVSCWGNGVYGQLGNGTTTSSSVPVKVQGFGKL